MSMSFRFIGVCLTWFQGSFVTGYCLVREAQKVCKSEGLKGDSWACHDFGPSEVLNMFNMPNKVCEAWNGGCLVSREKSGHLSDLRCILGTKSKHEHNQNNIQLIHTYKFKNDDHTYMASCHFRFHTKETNFNFPSIESKHIQTHTIQ